MILMNLLAKIALTWRWY